VSCGPRETLSARSFCSPEARTGAELYLDLLKKCLTRLIFPDQALQYDLVNTSPFVASDREIGRDWPTEAETMVGLERLKNVASSVLEVIETGVPGDLFEAGVWRGGVAILMRAVLKAYGDSTRTVWVADSFRGLPPPDPDRYPLDTGDPHHCFSSYLGVSMDDVQRNFARYGLLDSQVQFLPGWFKDTLPAAPVSQIAVLRIDGDMYESTIQALHCLYDKVSAGGFVIIDDYGALAGCRAAVDDFRRERGIADPLVRIDWTGVFWRKTPRRLQFAPRTE